MPSEAPEAGASSLPPPGAGARGEALSAAADRSEGLTSSPATIGVHQPWVEMLTLLVHWGMSIVHKRSGWIHSCAASALCATSALRAASGSTGSNLVLHLALKLWGCPLAPTLVREAGRAMPASHATQEELLLEAMQCRKSRAMRSNLRWQEHETAAKALKSAVGHCPQGGEAKGFKGSSLVAICLTLCDALEGCLRFFFRGLCHASQVSCQLCPSGQQSMRLTRTHAHALLQRCHGIVEQGECCQILQA
eukprot:1158333-Pelagomonas_calceolata.AAC.6